MTRKSRAFLAAVVSGLVLASLLGTCDSNHGGSTPPATPAIRSISNVTNPRVSVRSGDWCRIKGSSFGESQANGKVSFSDGKTTIPAAMYYLWKDDAIYCRVPSGFSEGGEVVAEELTVTVTNGGGGVSDPILIALDGVPNPAPKDGPPLIRKRPYAIYENDKSIMTIAWQTISTPDSAVIQWGKTSDHEQREATVTETGSGTDEHQFFTTLNGLEPDTLYYYEVSINGADTSSYTGSFLTAPAENASSLTFYGYGDTRDGMDPMNAVLGRLDSDVAQDPATRQTFCLHDGDFVHRGLTESYWDSQYFDPDYPSTMTFLSTMPVLAALGNHECYKQGDTNIDPATAGQLFRKYFPYSMYSTDYFYYSFDYGPLHVATIDPYKADITAGSDQLTWLNDDLAGSEKPWKIVMVHPPFYSGNRPDSAGVLLEQNVEPILHAQNVKLVVQGHVHYYSRSVKDGVTYLVLGGGGGPLVTPDPTTPYYVTGKSCYHFARFDITGDEMNITVIDDQGNLVEQVPTIQN